jgi:type I restriction enzyme, S subunit
MGTKPFYNSTIPNDWSAPEFGEVFSFLKSFSFSREQLTNEKTTDEIQNIHYGDIHATFENEILDFEIESRIPFIVDGLISKAVLSDEEFPLLKDGDLIIADASEDTVGVAECVELKNVNGRKIVSGLHTFAARDKDGKTAPGYRTYILKHPQVLRELKRIATGFSVFGVSKTNLAFVKLPLPPQNEQESIADLLHLMDTAININNSLIAKTELKKKWLMQNLLTGKKRLKGFENEKWKKNVLGNLCVIKGEYGINAPAVEYSSQLPTYLRITDISEDGKFISTGKKSVNDSDFQKYILQVGDIVFARTGASVGKTYLYNPADGELVFAGFLIRFRPNPNLLSSVFLKAYTETQSYWNWVKSNSARSGQPGINEREYSSMPLVTPSIDEQSAIAEVLLATDKEIQYLKAKSGKLREKKKGLVQILLTGKKRLK